MKLRRERVESGSRAQERLYGLTRSGSQRDLRFVMRRISAAIKQKVERNARVGVKGSGWPKDIRAFQQER